MTVSTTNSITQAFPNGVTTVYPVNYRFFDKADLKVFWQKPDGTIRVLVLDSEYTVQGAGSEAGGSITTIGTPLPNGALTIARVMTANQLTSFRNQGEFFPEIHEDAFDKLVMLVQQTIDGQGRGLTVPVADPTGLDLEIPGYLVRANKMLAFDANGSPIQSNLSLAELEQQPAGAAASAAAAAQSAANAATSASSASASANSANASKLAAAVSETNAAASAKAAADAGIQLGMSMWGFRSQPFRGFALDDGQELDRALYPDFAAALDAGLLPTTTEAIWQADTLQRGRFVANSSAGKFRMRDLNGKSSGSIGGVFQRGTQAGDHMLVRDTFQGHTFGDPTQPTVPYLSGLNQRVASSAASGFIGLHMVNTPPVANSTAGSSTPIVPMTDGANGTPRTGVETAPKYAAGSWMTRLFGIITPLGSAEANSLATAYASMASRISVLENRLTCVKWSSGDLNWPTGTRTTINHGLGAIPDNWRAYVRLTVATVGFNVGDIVPITMDTDYSGGTASYGLQLSQITATTLSFQPGNGGSLVMGPSSTPAQGVSQAQGFLRLVLYAFK